MSTSAGNVSGLRAMEIVRTVVSRTRKEAETILKLDSGQTVAVLPFAPVGPGDRLTVQTDGSGAELLLEDGRHRVNLQRAWQVEYAVRVGSEILQVTVKEVETEAEVRALAGLKQFHYRGEKTAGRAVPLIAIVSHRLLPQVVGFIELTSAMLVNTARKSILDRPFVDKEKCVSWQRWDMAAAKSHTRRLVRISRCVVYPELRGLGIASRLARAAADYAYERWHFGGARPVFLEITADMLRYSPFVESAGFTYVGETQGNEARMLRDMQYLLKRTLASGSSSDFPQGGGGIMSLQRSYATTLLNVMSKRGLALEQLINLLRRSPESLDDDEWIALHKVFRRPKPTYMYGLTLAAARHLKMSAPPRRVTNSSQLLRNVPRSAGPLLRVTGLNVNSSVVPSNSSRGRKVAEAFGVVSKRLDTALISKLDIAVFPGEVVLVTGPSGTGKSLLLKSMTALVEGRGEVSEGIAVAAQSVAGPRSVAWVREVTSNEAPVDLLKDVSIEEALSALGCAGLAEASLFVRPANSLSDGQRYRLAIACALSKSPALLFIDAFCEPLDDLSAAAVCKGLRAVSRKTGLGVMVATAAPDRLLSSLEPDQVIQLLPGRSVKIHRRTAKDVGESENQEGPDSLEAQG